MSAYDTVTVHFLRDHGDTIITRLTELEHNLDRARQQVDQYHPSDSLQDSLSRLQLTLVCARDDCFINAASRFGDLLPDYSGSFLTNDQKATNRIHDLLRSMNMVALANTFHARAASGWIQSAQEEVFYANCQRWSKSFMTGTSYNRADVNEALKSLGVTLPQLMADVITLRHIVDNEQVEMAEQTLRNVISRLPRLARLLTVCGDVLQPNTMRDNSSANNNLQAPAHAHTQGHRGRHLEDMRTKEPSETDGASSGCCEVM